MTTSNKQSLDSESEEALVRALKLRRKNNPHKYYIPNGACENFIKTLAVDQPFITLFCAANGVGKTAVGAAILANMFWPTDSKWFEFEFFKNFPYRKRGRIISDPTTIQNVIIPELKKWFPPGRYTCEKRGKNFESWWTTDTGFSFDILTTEQDVKEFESATNGWTWFDEPPPRAIYIASVARMRRGGFMFITATPLTGSSWMYDAIFLHANDEKRRTVTGDVEENCIEHGIRGILKHSDIERMIAEYDPEEIEARVHGKFQHLSGLVFKRFNPKIHVITPFKITKQDFVVWQALDPHPRNPDAVMWLAVNSKGTKFVVNEFYNADYLNGKWRPYKINNASLAEEIIRRDSRYRIEERICDPSAFNEDQHQNDPSAATLAAKLYDLGLQYQPATKDRVGANRRIKDALDYEKVGDEILSAPELYIFSTCVRTIWELEHYQWEEFRGKAAERKDPKETPQDKDDHMIECVSGDTLVDCLDRQFRIKDLVGKIGLVKTPNGLQRFSEVRRTRQNAEVYRLTLQNGKFVEATAEHLILSPLGWKELKDYKAGDLVIDIDLRNGYTREYEPQNYIQNLPGIFRKAILPLRFLFSGSLEEEKRFAFAQGGLGVFQRRDTQRFAYSPQRHEQGKQQYREFGIENSGQPPFGTYDTAKARMGKRKYAAQDYTGSGQMAQIAKSKMALRQIEAITERKNQTQTLQKSLYNLRSNLFYSTNNTDEILRQKMQSKGLGQVKEIKSIGFQDVYNMEVDNEHCFSVNGGIIAHNCLGRLLVQEPEFYPMPASSHSTSFGTKTNKEFDPFG